MKGVGKMSDFHLGLNISNINELFDIKHFASQYGVDFSSCPQCNNLRFVYGFAYKPNASDNDLGIISRNIYKCIECQLELSFSITNDVIGFCNDEEESKFIPKMEEVEIRFSLEKYDVGIFYDKNESRLWMKGWPEKENSSYIVMKNVLLKPNMDENRLKTVLLMLGPESTIINLTR